MKHKILIIAICGIGDMLFFLPSLQNLRKKYKDAKIDLLASPNGIKTLLEKTDYVNSIVEFPRDKWLTTGNRRQQLKNILKIFFILLKMRKMRYDVSIWAYAGTTPKKRLMSWIIRAKQNFIHGRRGFFENMKLFKSNRVVPYRRYRHSTELNFDTLRMMGIETKAVTPDLQFSRDEIDFGEELITRSKPDSCKLVIGFQTGGNIEWNNKRQWPPQRYAELANRIGENFDAFLLFFGSKNEKSALESLAAKVKDNCAIVCDLSIRQVAAVIKKCNLFIGNDSGLIHLAGAVGTPTLSIHGPTDVQYTGPWTNRMKAIRLDLPCSPCFDIGFASQCPHLMCLNGLSVSSVYTVVEEILTEVTDSKWKGYKERTTNIPYSIPSNPEFNTFLSARRKWEEQLV